MPLRVVLDTNVLYAGLRSRHGASFQILDALWQRQWTLLLSNTVLTEYEEILHRESTALRLNPDRIQRLLDALCAIAEHRHPSGDWVPILSDPDDEALAHLAVEARADHLVTHNLNHLAPARRAGVNLLAPRVFLAILRT